MALTDLVIRSQLIPPRQRRGVLRRPRLDARLSEVLDYPLTIVQAGTGYGKSTALASLGSSAAQLSWYTVTDPDRDPLLFLAHLVCAFQPREPDWCQPAMRALEEAGGRVTDLDGKPIDYEPPPGRPITNLEGLVASNGGCHEEILDFLRDMA